MENAAAIFYAESSVTGAQKIDELLAHEIAHQYFGDMVTETDWPQVWLSEGFATYLSLLFLEHKYGKDSLLSALRADRQKVTDFSKNSAAPVIDTAQKVLVKLLNPNSYQKGGWILHMLRRSVGDSTFWKILRKYYSDYAGKNASTDDFVKVVREVSGRDFGSFFRQWLYRPGQPRLRVDQHFDEKRKQLQVTVIQNQPELFQFPLTLKAQFSRSAAPVSGAPFNGLTKTINIRDRKTVLTIDVPSNPVALLIDPHCDLLFETVQ